VDPAARGPGVARTLVAACEELALDSEAPMFAFHTALSMNAAIASSSPVIAFRRDLNPNTHHLQRPTKGNDMNTELLSPVYRPEADTHDQYICPTCGGLAEVEWRDWSGSTSGPVEHVKIRCTNRHWFLMLAESLSARPER
jgi:hypothetical protein